MHMGVVCVCIQGLCVCIQGLCVCIRSGRHYICHIPGLDMTGCKSVAWGGVLSDKAALCRAIIQVLS